jgi:spermidine/putrescine transport system substrate-binding protein
VDSWRNERDLLARAVASRNEINRRRFVSMTGGAVALSLSGGLLAACGGDDDGGGGTPAKQLEKGTIKLGGYPDWIGSDNLSDFAKANPGSKVRQVSIPIDEDRIGKLATDPQAVDIMLITEKDVQRLIDLDVAAEVDLDAVPNYGNIDEEFKNGYAADDNARCVTTDYGKTGFAYRRDMVDDDLKSWADVWKVAEKYSGKITFLDFPAFVLGAALIANGHSISSTDEDELRQAGDKAIEIKPHLKQFVQTDLSKGLVDGSVAIAMDWDYDIYLAQQENENIVWVAPEDGTQTYLDVWVPISKSEHLPVVWKFFDFFYQPRQYANFVNTLGIAFCMGAAREFIDDGIANSEILYPPKEVLERVQYQKALGEGQKLWDREWQRIKAA